MSETHHLDPYTLLLQILQRLESKVDEQASNNLQLKSMLVDHIEDESAFINKVVQGFPGGDIGGHCEFHEQVMNDLREKSEFRKKIMFEMTKYGAIALLVWIANLVWKGVIAGAKS